jgi:endonuclease/exonuclease/phosphatase family metal-dependent hydrolase
MGAIMRMIVEPGRVSVIFGIPMHHTGAPLTQKSPHRTRLWSALSAFGLLLVGVSCAGKKVERVSPAVRGPVVKFDAATPSRVMRSQRPDYLTFAELAQLSRNPEPSGSLKAKLDRFWRTPLVDNDAWFSGRRPRALRTEPLGPILRVASWNIEKSLNIPQVVQALKSETAYEGMIDGRKAPAGSRDRAEMLRQRDRLASADIIFLQEMDIGVNRSGHVDAAGELARVLGMNYAFGAQALEVDPVLLDLEEPHEDDPKPAPVIPARFKGVFGSAVLSRYPIVNVEVFQLESRPYDWYHDEQRRADLVEQGRRLGSEWVFWNRITRELKVGGRCFLRVDVAVPGVPGGVVTLVNNHLEIKTRPKQREAQMVEILSHIKNISHPVIMAGDHNSAPNDVSATSLRRVLWRQVDTPSAFVSTAAHVSALAFHTVVPLYRERGVVNALKNFQAPLAPDVPILFPNHVLGLFNQVRDFRFDDGTAFDFRGDRERTINGRRGVLANSNERRFHGQRTTFSVRRPIGPIGRYRLDWIFVRSGLLRNPADRDAPYKLAPHFGETLAEFNEGLEEKFSDHRPIVVDIPLEEPASGH